MSKYLIIAIVVLLGLFGAYFKLTQNRIEALNQQVATLEVANQQNQATIDNMRTTALRNEQRNQELQTRLEQADASLNTLRRTLQEHDLSRLAAERPGLIEPRMQGATDELFNNYFSIDEPSSD